jgi:hypothetical protein
MTPFSFIFRVKFGTRIRQVMVGKNLSGEKFMFKKYLAALCLLFSVIFIFGRAAQAQETEAAASSDLTGIALPAGASRVLPGSVPAEITQVFDKITAAGNGKFRKGASEVLVWGGSNYKKADAAGLVNRLTATLKASGWQYSIEGDEGGLTLFTAAKEGAASRALVGFHGATDDALVFSWMEILPANGGLGNGNGRVDNRPEDNSPTENVQNTRNSGGGLVGTWTNGGTSMNLEKYMDGTTAFRNGTTYKYVFYPDGRFEFIGYAASTMYGCTTTLFNDKRGKYQIAGSQITLLPSKNFWRNQYSCAPNSNKERDYVLDRETYDFRTKTDEYGKTLVCLSNAKGESCYRREE